MSVSIDPEKAKNHTNATVWIKGNELKKVVISGKIVSAESDNFTISIQTETNYAVFDTKDVACINFG